MRWIIGDVHGMLKPLATLVNEIDRLDPQASLYFVGDYVNRGPESRGVIELLLTLGNAKFIRGNHDDVLDQILHGANYAENPSRGDRFMAFQWFLEHGLYETLVSYGVTRDHISCVISQRSRGSMQSVVDLFPERHRQFIRSLPVYIEDPDLFLVHGKWPLRESRSPAAVLGSIPHPQLRHELLWGRFTEAELQQKKAWPKVGFFGHTPVPTYRGHETDYSPIVAAKMILLDTAAALSPVGRLTAMCAETSQLIQAEPGGKLVSPASAARSA
jgi:serine/threonine protein phosphatase 1